MTHTINDILSLEDNYIKLYKFAFCLGSKLDVILSVLINAETWVTQGLSDDPDYFKCNIQGFMQNLLTGYSDHEIRSSINKLCDLGLISKRSININGNQSLFIKLNKDAIINYKNMYEQKNESCSKVSVTERKKQIQKF